MIASQVLKFAKPLVILLFIVLSFFFGASVARYSKNTYCRTPEQFGVEIAKIYISTIKNSLDFIPYEKDFIFDAESKQAKAVLKKIKKETVKASKDLKKCAVGYHNMDKFDKKYARNEMFSRIRKFRESEDGKKLETAIEKNKGISKQLKHFRNITRYAFIVPKDENVDKYYV